MPAPVPYANLTNPQTLNLYAMVSDNPETFDDLDGHGCSLSLFTLETSCSGTVEFHDPAPGEGFTAKPNTGDDQPASDSQQGEAAQLSDEQNQAQQQRIADEANSEVGSTAYLVSKTKGKYGADKDKCNELVADTIQASGLPRPQVGYTGWKGWLARVFGLTRDPTSHEWADPSVNIPGWSSPQPLSEARPGAVIAQEHGANGHAGIVVGSGQTVSANTAVNPAGLVTRNNWGFRPRGGNGDGPRDPAPVVRIYIGDH